MTSFFTLTRGTNVSPVPVESSRSSKSCALSCWHAGELSDLGLSFPTGLKLSL